jgi:GNAT superfamily N-acetyltransferase
MFGVASVRTFASHEWRSYRDLRLRALAESPDAFGSTLALEQDRSEEDWSERLTRGTTSGTDLPLVAEVNGQAVGLAWARIDASDPAIGHLYQMWVAPGFRGLGAGRLLLSAAIDWARAANVRALDLGVTTGNTSAERLYTRAGFKSLGDPHPLRPDTALVEHTMRLEFI